MEFSTSLKNQKSPSNGFYCYLHPLPVWVVVKNCHMWPGLFSLHVVCQKKSPRPGNFAIHPLFDRVTILFSNFHF